MKNYLSIFILAFNTELKTVLTHKGALLIIVGAVSIYSIVYSFAYSTEVFTEMPIAIVDLDNSQMSRKLSEMIDATEQLHVVRRHSDFNDAKEKFKEGELNGLVVIPKKFERNIYKGEQSHIGIYGDANNFLMYKQNLSGVVSATSTYSTQIEIKRFMAEGSSFEQAKSKAQAFNFTFSDLYNPSTGYGSFVMPPFMLVLIQQTLLIGIGLIGGFQRERNQRVYKIKGKTLIPSALLLGKAFAYFLITVFNVIVVLIWIHNWFAFPDKSSFINLLFLLIPFTFSVIFLGLLISIAIKKAENSIMFIVFLSPVVLFLAGFSWPVDIFPDLLKILRLIVPTDIVIPAYLRLRTMGASIFDIKKEILTINFQMVIYFILALMGFRFRAKLEKKTR